MKKIKPPVTANHNLSPKLVWMNNSRIILRFKGCCSKRDDVISSNVINLFIVYELDG